METRERLREGAIYGAVATMMVTNWVPLILGLRHSRALEASSQTLEYLVITFAATALASVLAGTVSFVVVDRYSVGSVGRMLANAAGGVVGAGVVFAPLHYLWVAANTVELAAMFGVLWVVADLLFESARRQEF